MASGGTPGGPVTIGSALVGGIIPARTEGRLTVVSGVPAPSGYNHGSTLYFTPYMGNHISLFTGGVWRDYTFPEISISNFFAGDVAVFDIFAYGDLSGNVFLEPSAAWANYTTRTDALSKQDGILVKASDPSRKLIGTVCTVSSGSHTAPFFFYDQPSARYVCNLYNTVPRYCVGIEGISDDDTLSGFTLTAAAAGGWQIPLFTGPNVSTYVYGAPASPPADGIYMNFVACQSMSVKVSAQVCMRNNGAVTYGAGITVSPGDDVYDPTKIQRSVQSQDPSLQDLIELVYDAPPGITGNFMAFFAEGGSQIATVLVDDVRRGNAQDPWMTYMTGLIFN